jgi:hypothetical protein
LAYGLVEKAGTASEGNIKAEMDQQHEAFVDN